MKNRLLKLMILQFSILLVLICIFLFVHSSFVTIIPSCFWKEYYHITCPSCGATRCVISLSNGNLQEAFTYHPFLFILISYLFFLDVIYIVHTITKKDFWKIFYPKWWYVILYACLWFGYTIYLNIK